VFKVKPPVNPAKSLFSEMSLAKVDAITKVDSVKNKNVFFINLFFLEWIKVVSN
jgi:hypothetical protein